jgi:hypothetical protein
MQARIIINVSETPQLHSNGLSGTWIVPGRTAGEEYGMLVVYPTPEIQDIGDERRVSHWLKATPLARDIVGLRSDAAGHTHGSPGTKEKWGLVLCEAEPDISRELEKAIEEETIFLTDNVRPVRMVKSKKDNGAVVAVNEDIDIREQKQALSDAVRHAREEFEKACRQLVTKKEIMTAKRSLQVEDQRLIAEADQMWARPAEQANINELHRNACRRMGQERPWCYVPTQLSACPGCGENIRENILSCPKCGGWLEEGVEKLRAMDPKQRARIMYPERYADPVSVTTGKPAKETRAAR